MGLLSVYVHRDAIGLPGIFLDDARAMGVKSECAYGTACSSLPSPAWQCFLQLRPHCRSREFPLLVRRP